LADQYQALFGLGGWIDTQAYKEASRIPDGPPVPFGWSLLFPLGNHAVLLTAFYWTALGIFVVFTLGLWPRLTSILTWLCAVSFVANPVTVAEPEHLLPIFAFYLMVGYLLLGQWHLHQSWLGRILGPARVWPLSSFMATSVPARETAPSHAANLAVRLLQVNFAIVVLTTGLHKLQSGDWWTGVAFWYPLHPPFQVTPESIQAEAANAGSYLFMLSLAQYIYLGWELAFPFFAWRKRWRPLLLGGAAVGWIGALAIYKAPLLGPIYFLGCLAFLTPAEWSWLAKKLGQGTSLARGEPQMIPDRPSRQQARA
jgi:hypothetical protein